MQDVHIEDLERRITKLENIYDTLTKMTINVEKIALELKYMRDDFTKLSNDVKSYDKRLLELENKPVKRYDTAINTIITGVVSALIGALMAFILRK